MNFYIVSTLLLTILAAVTRFYRLGKWSFWEDELFTIRHAADISKSGLKAIDNCHPLYYLSIIPVLQRFGITEWSARSTAALVGTLSIPILISAIEPILGTATALLFGALLAISPWHVYWSQNARFYSMTFLFQSLALFNLYFWVETNEWYRLALFLITYAISVLAHETSVLSLIVALGYLIGITIFQTTTVKNFTLLAAGVALLLAGIYTVAVFLFVGGGLRKRKKTINSHWTIHYSHRKSGPLRVLGGVLKFTGIATVCIGLLSLASRYPQFSHFDIFVATLIFVPLGIVTAVSFVAYSTTRYSFLSLVGFLLASSQIANELGTVYSWAGAATCAVLIVTALDDLVLYYFAQNGNRERWREVLLTIKPRIRPSDRVLTTTPDLATHYLGRPARWLTEFDCQMLEDLNGANWFVLNDTIQSLPQPVRNWIEENTTLLLKDEVHYHLKSWTVSVRYYNRGATIAIPMEKESPSAIELPFKTFTATLSQQHSAD